MKEKLFLSLICASVLSTSLLGAAPVFADDFDAQINEAQLEAEESQEAANDLDALINQLTNDMDSTQEALNNLNYEINKNEELLAETKASLDETNREMNQLFDELETLVNNIERRSVKLEEQAREIQVKGNSANYFEYILNSDSLTDVWARVSIVSNIIKSSGLMMEEQVKDKEAVAQKSQETERKVVQQNALVEQLEIASVNLEGQKASQEALVVQLEIEKNTASSNQDALIAQRNEALQRVSNIENEKKEAEKLRIAAEEKVKEERRLEQERLARQEEQRKEEERLAAARAKEKEKTNVEPATSGREESNTPAPPAPEVVEEPSTPKPVTPPVVEEPPVSSGGWLRPSAGIVTSRWGPRWGSFHSGIDLSTHAPNTSILAAKSGIVTTAANASDYGYYVIINHGNGLSSLYAHMLPGMNVSVGQRVEQGQKLGIMGSTGDSTGVHLHFEIRENGVRKNPELFMSF